MEQLPVETLQDIFTLACTDGGPTGCSLSLVSRSIRAVSRYVRFHSVALDATPPNLESLLESLSPPQAGTQGCTEQPASCVRHLSLTRPEYCEWTEAPDVNIPLDGRPTRCAEAYGQDSVERARQLVYRLLALVGPSLWTIALYAVHAGSLGYRFPQLREFTFFCHDYALEADPRNAPLFPSLQRLHVSNGYRVAPLLASWTKHAPRLTHLRVSGLCDVDEVIQTLAGAVGVDDVEYNRLMTEQGVAQRAVPRSPPHPSLRRVMLQPEPHLPSCCGDDDDDDNDEKFLNVFANAPKKRGVDVAVLENRWYADGYWQDRTRSDWQDRIEGGPGCWTTGEQGEDGPQSWGMFD